jgi:hypothetical protein
MEINFDAGELCKSSICFYGSKITSYSGEATSKSQSTNTTTISAPSFFSSSITNFNSQIIEG